MVTLINTLYFWKELTFLLIQSIHYIKSISSVERNLYNLIQGRWHCTWPYDYRHLSRPHSSVAACTCWNCLWTWRLMVSNYIYFSFILFIQDWSDWRPRDWSLWTNWVQLVKWGVMLQGGTKQHKLLQWASAYVSWVPKEDRRQELAYTDVPSQTRIWSLLSGSSKIKNPEPDPA